MNVFEAMSHAVKTGDKIRRKNWANGASSYFDKSNMRWVWSSPQKGLKSTDYIISGETLNVMVHRIDDEWEVIREPEYVWINVYKDGSKNLFITNAYPTKRDADFHQTGNRVGCIKVELREEFDEEVQP